MFGRVPFLCVGVSVAVAMIVTPLSATAGSSSRPVFPARLLTVHGAPGQSGGPILGLTLDGIHAAYVGAVQTRTCGLGERVFRWDLATGRSSAVSGSKTCAQPQTSTGRGIFELALAGKRATWLVNFGGNTESGEILYSSTASPGKDTSLAGSDRIGRDLTTLAGTWIGGLVSDGSRISYATWTTKSDGTVTSSSLWRISGSHKAAIARGTGAVVAAVADEGRVALLRSDGSVGVYGIDGRLMRTVTPSPAKAVALSGTMVAVLTKADAIEVYSRTSGALLHRWQHAGGSAAQFDASAGIAVFVRGGSVHALNLRTGKDVVVASSKRPIRDARLDQAGLLYDYNFPWSTKEGKIVFVPFAAVVAKLGL